MPSITFSTVFKVNYRFPEIQPWSKCVLFIYEPFIQHIVPHVPQQASEHWVHCFLIIKNEQGSHRSSDSVFLFCRGNDIRPSYYAKATELIKCRARSWILVWVSFLSPYYIMNFFTCQSHCNLESLPTWLCTLPKIQPPNAHYSYVFFFCFLVFVVVVFSCLDSRVQKALGRCGR